MPLYQPNHILLNKYRIESFIGAGAFAEVYQARHLALNAPRALKVLRRDVSGIGSTEFGDYEQRFRLEAQLGAAIDHPHVMRVHDFEQEGDLLVLVMAYADGGSLTDRIQRRRELRQPMDVDEAVRIAREVAQGLAALHDLDAVHRDVKPSNILFDRAGRAMLADLGLAQAPGGPSMRSIMSQAMSHPGTPAYMSPEQAGGFGHLSPSSDVYALGAVLFEMLTGRLYKNVRPGTAVTKYRKDAPDWLVEALGRMLAKSPEDRPWDGEEVGEMLQVAGGGSQVAGGGSQVAGRGASLRSPQEDEEKAQRVAEERERKQVENGAAHELSPGDVMPGVVERMDRMEYGVVESTKVVEETRSSRIGAMRKKEIEPANQSMSHKLQIPKMVKVPAGEFTTGSDIKKDPDASGAETPQHHVFVDAFEIGKYPVTNEQYAVFVRDTGQKPPQHWKGGKIPKNKENHPVVYVSWHDAAAYCQWLSEKTGQTWRLPTEAEWEKAARGADGRIYPWGNEKPDKKRCNFNMNVKDTTPVGQYPAGVSPYGALDMAGNVWEWTSSLFKDYPYKPDDGREDPEASGSRVLRGGSWFDYARYVRSAYRNYGPPAARRDLWGFRPARS